MARDKVFLVIVRTPSKSSHDFESIGQEMKELAESARGIVVGSLNAHVLHPSPSHFIRQGKLQEICREIQTSGANVLIFSVDLSPVQARNIENECHVRVVDRTGLILDIFARRAVSSDGKLQVELAQLQYLLPRLVGQGVILSRLGGGIGTRGPGEQKLEVDRRKIRSRIEHIQGQLQKLRKHRALIRDGRKQKGLAQVAIVGYTNAGKSTLLNALTGADAYVEDRLFATLDPKTRIYNDGKGKPILFTDTVGFIRDLPHGLVKAFHATLEETLEADVILEVVDASNQKAIEHKYVVEEVLKELGVTAAKKILALNKVDLLCEEDRKRLREVLPEGVLISAATRYGLKDLIVSIQKALDEKQIPETPEGEEAR